MKPDTPSTDVRLAALQDRLWSFVGVAIIATLLMFVFGLLGEHFGFRFASIFVGLGCLSAGVMLLLWTSMMGVDVVRIVSSRRYRTFGRIVFTFPLEVPFGCFVLMFAVILLIAAFKNL